MSGARTVLAVLAVVLALGAGLGYVAASSAMDGAPECPSAPGVIAPLIR